MAEPSNPGSGPFAAGTTYDTIAHTVLDPAGSQLGRTFVLENRPGGGGTAALASVVKASPDGYTMLLATSAMTAGRHSAQVTALRHRARSCIGGYIRG